MLRARGILILARVATTVSAGFCALVISAGGSAAEPRITSLEVRDGGLVVKLAGVDDLTVRLDGVPVTPERIGAESGYAVLELTNLPEHGRILAIDPVGGETLAIAIGADEDVGGRFNDWNVYHVMLSYFANGSRDNDKYGMRKWIHRNYAGGDLQGVLDKVDYIADLGMNAVWFSPVFASETSHGYDVTNYFEIGQGFAMPRDAAASRQLFDTVVDLLHERGIRVILDLPLDYGSGAYDRRAGDPQRRRPKSTGPRQEAEKMWASWGTDFRYWNFDDAGTREFLKDAARFWVTEGGVDGLRLDYVRGVPHDFWAELYTDLKQVRPDVFLFGEAWQDASSVTANALDIATYYSPVDGIGSQFDGLLDYPLQMVMTDVFATGGPVIELEIWLQKLLALYDPQGRPVHFLDNHDVSRFLAWADDRGQDRLVAAVAFMASLSSPLVVFYGTEAGLAGGSATRGFVDDGRVAMPWKSLDHALIARVTRIMKARSEVPALTHGGRWPLYADERALVMRKVHADGDVLVGVNMASEPCTIVLPATVGRRWSSLLGETVPEGDSDDTIRWTLPPISTSWARTAR